MSYSGRAIVVLTGFSALSGTGATITLGLEIGMPELGIKLYPPLILMGTTCLGLFALAAALLFNRRKEEEKVVTPRQELEDSEELSESEELDIDEDDEDDDDDKEKEPEVQAKTAVAESEDSVLSPVLQPKVLYYIDKLGGNTRPDQNIEDAILCFGNRHPARPLRQILNTREWKECAKPQDSHQLSQDIVQIIIFQVKGSRYNEPTAVPDNAMHICYREQGSSPLNFDKPGQCAFLNERYYNECNGAKSQWHYQVESKQSSDRFFARLEEMEQKYPASSPAENQAEEIGGRCESSSSVTTKTVTDTLSTTAMQSQQVSGDGGGTSRATVVDVTATGSLQRQISQDQGNLSFLS